MSGHTWIISYLVPIAPKILAAIWKGSSHFLQWNIVLTTTNRAFIKWIALLCSVNETSNNIRREIIPLTAIFTSMPKAIGCVDFQYIFWGLYPEVRIICGSIAFRPDHGTLEVPFSAAWVILKNQCPKKSNSRTFVFATFANLKTQ